MSFRSFLGSFGLTLQQQFNVVLAKTVMELNGISCLPLEEVPPTRQQIIASRSFGLPVTTFEMLSEAVASHTRPGGGQAAAGIRCQLSWPVSDNYLVRLVVADL